MNSYIRHYFTCSAAVSVCFFMLFMYAFVATPNAYAKEVISLDGVWNFAIDPMRLGEKHGWNAVPADWNQESWIELKGWDKVDVPHDYITDPRYEWTGAAWYRKSVKVAEASEGSVYRLQFERVSTKCEVWINGKEAGSHKGGYTPFEFDVTKLISPGKTNHIAIKVDNSWEIGDIPGPRKGKVPNNQMYVWRNYGGILRSCRLVISPAVYVANQKVVAEASQPNGDVKVTTRLELKNGSSKSHKVHVELDLLSGKEKELLTSKGVSNSSRTVRVAKNKTKQVVLETTISSEDANWWTPDHPHLYTSKLSVSGSNLESSTHEARFGIRTIAVQDGKLLLNGSSIRIAGANRVEGHPKHGGIEPDELIASDLTLMKKANLEFHRLQHYPVPQQLLDWADENGMLIICEAPCWGLGPAELSDKRYQDNFESQFIEMIEASWNHPSVIGWSVGNEYQAWTEAGCNWTRKFADLAKEKDPTRITTYAALGYDFNQKAPSKERRSMHWVDLISVNYYTSGQGAGNQISRIHKTWPEKPILISEYGKRSDQASEEQRIKHFRDTLQAIRSREYVVGMSYWSFNDYRSRYPGTNRNGYRPWGIVEADRTPRELYFAMQDELSAATLEIVQESPLRVRVTARKDFPSYDLQGYTIRTVDSEGASLRTESVPDLSPGDSIDLELGSSPYKRIELVRPTGFVSASLHDPSRLQYAELD